ncbi:MAG: hypothetical protein ACRAVC_01930 [Trichormus sp.]
MKTKRQGGRVQGAGGDKGGGSVGREGSVGGKICSPPSHTKHTLP